MRRSSSSFYINLISKYSIAAASYQPINAEDGIACRGPFAFRLNGAFTSKDMGVGGRGWVGQWHNKILPLPPTDVFHFCDFLLEKVQGHLQYRLYSQFLSVQPSIPLILQWLAMFPGQHATGCVITWRSGSMGEIRDWVSMVQWSLHQVKFVCYTFNLGLQNCKMWLLLHKFSD